jgi:hypothetical protein
MSHPAGPRPTARRRGRGAVWAAGLLVALGAGAATAHGLYEVAIAARVPAPIAWLYPLITDGLALVAYAATARLTDAGRSYAWSVVILAAGLSGLAQATYLAGTVATAAPVGLRFGVGAWPAIAAAIVAHLLYLLGTNAANCSPSDATSVEPSGRSDRLLNAAVRPGDPVSTPPGGVHRPVQASDAAVQPASNSAGEVVRRDTEVNGASARDRALAAAREHHSRHGQLPTVTQLMALAQVARGSAGTVLKALRAERPALHIVRPSHQDRTEQ